jgi:rRNA maturation endonuclease Nob1
MQRQYQCDNCDAEFKIKHFLDECYYEVNFCPFCSGDITEGEEDEEDYE